MAKRGPSHNFVKQEKERKRLKKAALKSERRQQKKLESASEENSPEVENNAVDTDGALEPVSRSTDGD